MTTENEEDDETRDGFLLSVRDTIAKKSGYICAYPDCKKMTVSGSADRQSGITVLGVAAHITAASKKGPRYDKDMSHEERKSESNGIWTCQNHGKFIDDNTSKCTVNELRRWKEQHENWVFKRVESGRSLFSSGIYRISFENIGIFESEYHLPFGRHNILVGDNDTGKTSFCHIMNAFSGGNNWRMFSKFFDFDKSAKERRYISIAHQDDQRNTNVKLSSQLITSKGDKKIDLHRLHIEVNNCVAVDWPRSSFRTLYFYNQLIPESGDSKNIILKGIRYLASTFNTQENLILDSLREELFATSLFGYQFRRNGRRRIEVKVPDGRDFYLPPENLSSSEQILMFIDIALRYVLASSPSDQWLLIFDNSFMPGVGREEKITLYKKMSEFCGDRVQTLFCFHLDEDAEDLKVLWEGKWINAVKFQEITLHSFL